MGDKPEQPKRTDYFLGCETCGEMCLVCATMNFRLWNFAHTHHGHPVHIVTKGDPDFGRYYELT